MDEKRGVGRPTKYEPDVMIPTMLAGFEEGMSKTEVAAMIGITRETMRVWSETYPQFSAAIKQGVDLSEAWWEKQSRRALFDKDFQATNWIFNMKNRFGWRDKQEVTGDPERPQQLVHRVVDAVGIEELGEAFAKAKGTD